MVVTRTKKNLYSVYKYGYVQERQPTLPVPVYHRAPTILHNQPQVPILYIHIKYKSHKCDANHNNRRSSATSATHLFSKAPRQPHWEEAVQLTLWNTHKLCYMLTPQLPLQRGRRYIVVIDIGDQLTAMQYRNTATELHLHNG